jgi:hypothetical protein
MKTAPFEMLQFLREVSDIIIIIIIIIIINGNVRSDAVFKCFYCLQAEEKLLSMIFFSGSYIKRP